MHTFRIMALCWIVALHSTALHSSGAVTGGKARLTAWKKNREMAASSPFKHLEWQTLGPKFAGGRIESIDAPRGKPGTIYVGVGAGGVWKTTNGGLTWDAIFDRESTFAVGDLTVAPSDPKTIWVGTGEAHQSGTSYPGTGVFKSTDGGRNWTNVGLHDSHHIGKVVVHPKDPNIVYVAAMGPKYAAGGQRGVYKTTDGGKTFRRVLFAGERVGVVDLVLDPTDNDRLYAAAWDARGHKKSGVFRTTDAGENWVRLEGGLLDKEVGRVAVDASASEPGVVYALMVDHSPPGGGRRGVGGVVFRSDDAGDTWNKTHEDYLPTYVGWDFCDIRISPDNADEIYVAGFRLLASRDGGKTFERGGEAVYRLHSHRGEGMHLDIHDVWIDPENPDRVILGNDGGLYISWDRARTWLHLNNLPIAEFYRVHVDDDQPFGIWGGTQDNASFVAPSTARFEPGKDDIWEQVFLDRWAGGDGFSTFPDPHDSQTVYFTQQTGDLRRGRRGEIRGARRIRPRNRNGEPPFRWHWDTPFFASTHGTKTILYCAAQRVMKSENRGESWQEVGPDLGSGPLAALSESPIDPKRLVAGGGEGELHFTDDGGQSWRAAGKGLPPVRVRDVVTSAHDPNVVYVTLSGRGKGDFASYVYVTRDFGRTWESIANNLPAEPANAIAEDPKAGNILFVGTDLGVYVSVTSGEVWESLCHTLPTAPVVDLAVQGRDAALVAATHGLSMFLLDFDEIRTKHAAWQSTSPEARLKSWERHVRLENESEFKALKWRAIGPRKQGGRIESIACPPGNTSVMYVAVGSGNLWKTVNNGTTWKPIFENESTGAMGDVAVATSEPNVVWLGTGEVLLTRNSALPGMGVFKSTDGGGTWKNMGLNDTHHIGRVLIDPKDASVVYVAAIGHQSSPNKQRGVFKTTDGGETWERSLFIDDRTSVIDMCFDPGNRNTIYATSWQRGIGGQDHHGPNSGVHKTVDGGKTWRRLAGGLPSGDSIGRIGIDVSASNPSVVYALVDQGRADGLYRSDDGGNTWMKVNREPVKAQWDWCEIRVSPDNENELYNIGQRSFVSRDGGKTFKPIGGTIVHLLPHDSKVLHLDTHAMWIDPLNTDRIVFGNDGGLFFSYDRGESWLHVNNIPIAECYAVTYDMEWPYNIYIGTQDNAALYGPSNEVIEDGGPDNWRHVYLDRWGGGDSYFTYRDPTDSSTIYYESQNGGLRRKNMDTGEVLGIRPSLPNGQGTLRFAWMTPFFPSVHEPRSLYCGANYVFKSLNRGGEWKVISPDLAAGEDTPNLRYKAIMSLAESPRQQGLLFAGTDNGALFVTRNDGENWESISEGLPRHCYTRVVASPHNSDTVYVTLTGMAVDDFSPYVFRSDDQGKTWRSIATGLPLEPVNVIHEDPHVKDLLYLGTTLGVYVSVDGGVSWQSLCNNLPTTSVHDLFVHPRDNELVIGTHGRSVFVMDVSSITSSDRSQRRLEKSGSITEAHP